jgi:hypothetical protein
VANSETELAPPLPPARETPGVIPKIAATSSGQTAANDLSYKWRPLVVEVFLLTASSMARRAAHARYSAVDLRGSPGLLPRRSVGVSPMPTIAVFPRMLMNHASIRVVF